MFSSAQEVLVDRAALECVGASGSKELLISCSQDDILLAMVWDLRAFPKELLRLRPPQTRELQSWNRRTL